MGGSRVLDVGEKKKSLISLCRIDSFCVNKRTIAHFLSPKVDSKNNLTHSSRCLYVSETAGDPSVSFWE